jgi:hypothetical protein
MNLGTGARLFHFLFEPTVMQSKGFSAPVAVLDSMHPTNTSARKERRDEHPLAVLASVRLPLLKWFPTPQM